MTKFSKDAMSGVLFLIIGSGFAGYAWSTLPIGTAFRMGPGLFPLLVASLLALFGLGIIITNLNHAAVSDRQIPWRGIVLIAASLIGFGLLVRPLGMAPALFLSSLIGSFASRYMTVQRALMTSAGLTIVCVILFGYLLDLSLPMLGDWFH